MDHSLRVTFDLSHNAKQFLDGLLARPHGPGLHGVLQRLDGLLQGQAIIMDFNQKTAAAVAALTATETALEDKVGILVTGIEALLANNAALPQKITDAVAAALAEAGHSDETIAATVDAVKAKVQAVVDTAGAEATKIAEALGQPTTPPDTGTGSDTGTGTGSGDTGATNAGAGQAETTQVAGDEPQATDGAVVSTDPAHGATADQPVIVTQHDDGTVMTTPIIGGDDVPPASVSVAPDGTPTVDPTAVAQGDAAPVLGATVPAPDGTPAPADIAAQDPAAVAVGVPDPGA